MNNMENIGANIPIPMENQEKPPVVIDNDIATKRFTTPSQPLDKDLLGGVTIEKDRELAEGPLFLNYDFSKLDALIKQLKEMKVYGPEDVKNYSLERLELERIERDLKSLDFLMMTQQKINDAVQLVRSRKQYEYLKEQYKQASGSTEWKSTKEIEMHTERGDSTIAQAA